METLTLEPVLVDRRFKSPTNLVQAKDGQVWMTEQAGSVWVFDEPELDDATVTEAMDITGRVNSRGSEEGLLGLASDPKTEGHLYIYYSAANPRRSITISKNVREFLAHRHLRRRYRTSPDNTLC